MQKGPWTFRKHNSYFKNTKYKKFYKLEKNVFVVWQGGEWVSRVTVMYVVTRNADDHFYIEPVRRPGLLDITRGETLRHHIRAQTNAGDKVATWCVC
jgi:hypothetical protein